MAGELLVEDDSVPILKLEGRVLLRVQASFCVLPSNYVRIRSVRGEQGNSVLSSETGSSCEQE